MAKVALKKEDAETKFKASSNNIETVARQVAQRKKDPRELTGAVASSAADLSHLLSRRNK